MILHRYGYSAIDDSARDRMVISHDFTNTGRFDDTWGFDFAPNSTSHQMVYKGIGHNHEV